MKWWVSIFAFALLACGSEADLAPANSATFVRYFNGGAKDEAVGFAQLADGGFLVLANSASQLGPELPVNRYFKIIRTNSNGNTTWTQVVADQSNRCDSYVAQQIIASPDGGFKVLATFFPCSQDSSSLLLVDGLPDGSVTLNTFEATDLISPQSPNALTGLSFILNSNNDLVILFGSGGLSNIGLAEVDDQGKNIIQSALFTGGMKRMIPGIISIGINQFEIIGQWTNPLDNTIINELIQLDIAAGTMQKITIPTNPGFLEVVNSFSASTDRVYLYGWGNEGMGGNPGVAIPRYEVLDVAGNIITYNYLYDFENQNANQMLTAGFPITDGGQILVGNFYNTGTTTRTPSQFGLAKMDPQGAIEWLQFIGGGYTNKAVSVIQTADGGYAILGTTVLTPANVPSVVTLIKTNSTGKLAAF